VGRDPLFAGLRTLRCGESHQWQVARVARGYRVVARSPDGIEAARHQRLPRIGLQFHPEYFRHRGATTDGRHILMNWLASLAAQRTAAAGAG
jgi:GMP synthase-like glutamine amidotransferase